MWTLFVAIALDTYRTNWSKAEVLAGDVAALVAQDVARIIQTSDLSLRLAERDIRDRRSAGGAARPSPKSDLEPVLVLDETGRVVFDSTGIMRIGTDLSARTDFVAQRDGRVAQQPFVGRRIDGRSEGVPGLAISRPISDRDGRFAGVVFGTISFEAFRRSVVGARLPLGSTIALSDEVGTTVMLEPFGSAAVEPGRPESDASIASKPKSPVTDVRRSTFDKAERLYVRKDVPAQPMVLTIAIPTERILHHGRLRIELVGFGFLVMTATICGLWLTAAIELQRRGHAEHRLVELATTDSLTHLANRRRFDEALDLEWRRAVREETAISLLMVDGDVFKAFNDTYGHVEGDEALRRLADALRLCASRSGDLVARIGGEEFVVLLPWTDAVGAAAIARAIRQSVLALAIPHTGSPHGVLTVSIGVASRRPSRQSGMDLVAAADAALYQAKARGRDCIVMEETSRIGAPPRVA